MQEIALAARREGLGLARHGAYEGVHAVHPKPLRRAIKSARSRKGWPASGKKRAANPAALLHALREAPPPSGWVHGSTVAADICTTRCADCDAQSLRARPAPRVKMSACWRPPTP